MSRPEAKCRRVVDVPPVVPRERHMKLPRVGSRVATDDSSTRAVMEERICHCHPVASVADAQEAPTITKTR